LLEAFYPANSIGHQIAVNNNTAQLKRVQTLLFTTIRVMKDKKTFDFAELRDSLPTAKAGSSQSSEDEQYLTRKLSAVCKQPYIWQAEGSIQMHFMSKLVDYGFDRDGYTKLKNHGCSKTISETVLEEVNRVSYFLLKNGGNPCKSIAPDVAATNEAGEVFMLTEIGVETCISIQDHKDFCKIVALMKAATATKYKTHGRKFDKNNLKHFMVCCKERKLYFSCKWKL